MIDVALLIELIQQYPVLYDKSRKDFKNQQKKNNAWKELAETLDEESKFALTIFYDSLCMINGPFTRFSVSRTNAMAFFERTLRKGAAPQINKQNRLFTQ